MKQIKVELTPKEWAEKRLQLFCSFKHQPTTEILDNAIEQCGFVLKEQLEAPLPKEKLDDPTTKEWTGYFTESGERVYLNGEYVFNDVKMRIEKKESQYVCVREDGFVQPLYHVFIYHKP